METSLALAVVAHGGTGAVALLDYLVTGEREPLLGGASVDWCYAPNEGWVV
jgi:hypothetical protein